MYLTKLQGVVGDDYKQHQYLYDIYDQKVLFQRTDSGLVVISDNAPPKIETEQIDIDSLIKDEQHYFTVRLNPSKRDFITGKKVGLSDKDIRPWINKIFMKSGVESNFQFINEGIRESKKKGSTIKLLSVMCMGILTVVDSDYFRDALINGMGIKNFLGFGLINIFNF